MNWLGYWLFYAFPLAVVGGTLLGGPWAFLAPALAGVAVPLLDAAIGDDLRNPGPEEEARLGRERRWRAVLYPLVPVRLALVLWGAHWVATHAMGPAAWVALVLGVGVVGGGLAINVAHELCHRPGRLEQAMAKALWLSVGYLHFHLEHRLGHHARVATPLDPATARLGESLYAFLPRSMAGGFASAWRLERTRLGLMGVSVLSWRNQMLWFTALPPAGAAAVAWAWGPAAGAFVVAQAIAAVLVLETVNYLEHYGLERRLLAPGVFEPVGLAHSWNSNRRFTNYLLLKLQRHSDHHVNPGRRFQVLRAFEEGPTLPTGYGGMVLLALVPPLWHRVMDPRVVAARLPPPSGGSKGGSPPPSGGRTDEERPSGLDEAGEGYAAQQVPR